MDKFSDYFDEVFGEGYQVCKSTARTVWNSQQRKIDAALKCLNIQAGNIYIDRIIKILESENE